MTSRQLFEYALIELNKVQAPSLLLDDYLYFINKTVTQFINKIYNSYEERQQETDNLRVFKASAILTPVISNNYGSNSMLSNTYEISLPDDYLHILNCVVEYTLLKNFNCKIIGETMSFGAKRLTADAWPQVLSNYYFKPNYKRPYYYLNNVTINPVYPTTDNVEDITFGNSENIARVPGVRYGNKSKVKMEIRNGKSNPSFVLSRVYIDYLRSPQFIHLSQEEIDEVEDNSQVLEFPDYICQEIVNELVKFLMENTSDPRLQSHIPVNQSISSSAQSQPKR